MSKRSERRRLAREAHVNVLVAANRFREEIDRLCREESISHPQYVALWVLCLAEEADRGLPMGEIADGLFNRASDTTRLVDRLVLAGLAERRPSAEDRRVVLVRATDRGRALFGRLTPKVEAYHRRQWAALSDAELEQVHRLLAKTLWGESAEA
jgi:DNA-binding MarR family transcriptional regulator